MESDRQSVSWYWDCWRLVIAECWSALVELCQHALEVPQRRLVLAALRLFPSERQLSDGRGGIHWPERSPRRPIGARVRRLLCRKQRRLVVDPTPVLSGSGGSGRRRVRESARKPPEVR